MTEQASRRGLMALLLLQGALFVLLPMTGSPQSWGIFAALNSEAAVDLLGPGSWFDAYDGMLPGPLMLASLELPLLLVLGLNPWVHILATAGIVLGTTAATWAWLRREAGPTAALAGAALIAFPPPNTWYHQHQGAYHVAGLLLLMVGLLLLPAQRTRPAREIAGWAALFAALAVAMGSIGVVASIGAVLWGLRAKEGVRAALQSSGELLAGALLGTWPIAWKLLLHTPYGGLADASQVAGRTKPFFVQPPGLSELPARLWTALGSDLPFGLHFGRHGLPPLDVVAALLLVAALGLVALRPPRRWWPVAAAPWGALAVGVLTGWWVMRPMFMGTPFPRDARHLVAFTAAASLGVGLLVEAAPRQARAVLLAGVAAVTLGSAATMVRAFGGPPGAVPFRLEGRFLMGFFAGPVLPDADAARQVCGLQAPERRRDCLRGIAWAWGHGPARRLFQDDAAVPGEIEARCRALDPVGVEAGLKPGELLDECWFGLGFGVGDAATWRPRVAAGVCRTAKAPMPEAVVGHCITGVGFGHAQNFWNVAGEMAARTEAMPPRDRAHYASGIGASLAIIGADPGWIAQQCGRQVAPDHVDACHQGARRSQRFLLPVESP